MPPKLATSPMAQMPGTSVEQSSEMTTPPRGPSWNCGAVPSVVRAVGQAEQFVAGPDADGDDHDVGVDDPAVGHEHAGDLAVVVGEDLGGEHAAVDGEAFGFDQPAQGLPGALVQLGVHQPGRAVDDDRGGAELFGAGSGLEAQQAAADGDRVDLAAELRGQLRDRLVDGPDVLEGAVHVGEFGAGDGQAGRVGTGGDDQLVVGVHGAGRRRDGLGGGVEAGDALAGLEGEGVVVPHGRGAEREVHVAVGQGLAQRDAVVGEVRFLGEDRNVPAVEAPGVHGVGEAVGCRAAAGNHDAAGVSGRGERAVSGLEVCPVTVGLSHGPQTVLCSLCTQPRQVQFRFSFPYVS